MNDMEEGSRKAFYLAIKTLYLLGKKDIIINTGNWGSGAFKWTTKGTHYIQWNSIIHVWAVFNKEYPDNGARLIFKHHAFTNSDFDKIMKVRTTWGYSKPTGAKSGSGNWGDYINDTVYFNEFGTKYTAKRDEKKYFWSWEIKSDFIINFSQFFRFTNVTEIVEGELIPLDPTVILPDNVYAQKFDGFKWKRIETFFQIFKLFKDDDEFDERYWFNIQDLANKYDFMKSTQFNKSVGDLKKDVRELGKIGQSKIRSDWDELKFEVMLYAIREKFRIKENKDLLLSTRNMYLVEETTDRRIWDSIWGNSSSPKGQTEGFFVKEHGKVNNFLGQILILVLKELSERNPTPQVLKLWEIPKDFFGMEMLEKQILKDFKPEFPPIEVNLISKLTQFVKKPGPVFLPKPDFHPPKPTLVKNSA